MQTFFTTKKKSQTYLMLRRFISLCSIMCLEVHVIVCVCGIIDFKKNTVKFNRRSYGHFETSD